MTEPASNPQALADRCRVAVVADDDDFFRLAMAGLLRTRHRFDEVLEVCTLEEAAALLASRSEIVFASFDLGMPGMGDMGRMRTLRLAHPGVRMAIVSGTFDREIVLRALAAGLHGYVPKTMGAAQLGRAIGLVLDGEIYVPPAMADLGDDAVGGRNARPRPELTGRQRQVLGFIARGATNRDIAEELRLGEGTVKIHVAGLLKALGVANRSAAAATLRGTDPVSATKP